MKKFFGYYVLGVALFSALLLTESKRKSSGEIEVNLRYEENYSITYSEAINAYKSLDKKYPEAKLFAYGRTGTGHPLHLFVIAKSRSFDPKLLKKRGFRIVLVNNGIHPGEPCGIDASVKFASDVLAKADGLYGLLDSTVICIIPVYNIAGAHNRSPYNRANQNGPEEQGFRANARNLDLNRDFAPMDSRDAQSFAQIIHTWKPHLLIDTHTTNGADYQYVMTLIGSHYQGFPPALGEFYDSKVEPFLYHQMEKSGYEMIPYVDPMGDTPESGLQSYISSPRYTTGYGRMFNIITLMPEAHMFKPFSERVLATYEFIKASVTFAHQNGIELASKMDQAHSFSANQTEFVLTWQLDSTRVEYIPFKGYEAEYIPSNITGGKRLFYNREKPFTKEIPFYKHYIPTLTVTKPDFYVIPQAWIEAIRRLHINDIQLDRIKKDTTMEVSAYYIESYETYNRPYNGHYLHYNVKVREEKQSILFFKGDYIVHTNQPYNEYIVQMLEPQAYDSFFAWNFFDAVLQRKEYFSPYVFEDYAERFLAENPKVKEDFERRKKEDKSFAENPYAQLSFIYQRSPYFEKSFMRYPVYRGFNL